MGGAGMVVGGAVLIVKLMPLGLWPLGVGLWLVWAGMGPLIAGGFLIWLGWRMLSA